MSVLDRIFTTKREEVAAARAKTPETELRARIADQAPPRKFLQALVGHPDLALIAEIKKASPSQGLIRPDFDPAAIAQTYEAGGAGALSVLTDETYFQGSLRNLALARSATGLPALRKDFLYDPYQVLEARAWGADAVLLIAAALPSEQLAALHRLANELGMDALVEVHSLEEAERANALACPLVGVNNRNLADFKTDLGISETLLPRLASATVRVSESALETRADLDRVRAAGAQAVLIGTRFTSAPDIAGAMREVLGR